MKELARVARESAMAAVAPAMAALEELARAADTLIDNAARQPAIAPVARKAGEAIKASLEDKNKRDKTLQQRVAGARAEFDRLQPEVLAAKALRSSCAMGARRYATSQQLTVQTKGGVWRDAEVEAEPRGIAHRLRLEGDALLTLALHPWNHAPRELPHAAFEQLRAFHAASLRAQHSVIVDALSGKKLDALEQCVAIDVVGGDEEMAGVKDARALGGWLRARYAERVEGGAADRLMAVLLTAGPAAGKTTMLSQVVLLPPPLTPSPPSSLLP